MSFQPNVPLLNALKTSIDRMTTNFASNWLITGAKGFDNVNWPSYSDTRPDAGYEKIIEPDQHPFTEVCICLKGIFALQLENRMVDIKEGDVCLVLPGIVHAELPKRDFEYIAVWMSVDLNRSILHLSGKNRERAFFTIDGYSLKPDYEYIHTINRLKNEIDGEMPFSSSMAKTHVIQLFTLVLREISRENGRRSGSNIWKESVVLEVQRYIQNNHTRHLRLGDISQTMCISANYLNTMFKSLTGKTIMQYTEDLRLDRAKHLLLQTDMSVNSVSMELGYYDQYHFSNIFKKAVGVSPTQFRKSQLNFTSK